MKIDKNKDIHKRDYDQDYDYDQDKKRDDAMEQDDKQFVDALLRQQFGEDVPPEAEARMQGRLDDFRQRLDAREASENGRRRGWAAWLFSGQRAFMTAALGGVSIVVAGIMVHQNMIVEEQKSKVSRVISVQKTLSAAIEDYYVDQSLGAVGSSSEASAAATSEYFGLLATEEIKPIPGQPVVGNGEIALADEMVAIRADELSSELESPAAAGTLMIESRHRELQDGLSDGDKSARGIVGYAASNAVPPASASAVAAGTSKAMAGNERIERVESEERQQLGRVVGSAMPSLAAPAETAKVDHFAQEIGLSKDNRGTAARENARSGAIALDRDSTINLYAQPEKKPALEGVDIVADGTTSNDLKINSEAEANYNRFAATNQPAVTASSPFAASSPAYGTYLYNPSDGTVSSGDVWRTQDGDGTLPQIAGKPEGNNEINRQLLYSKEAVVTANGQAPQRQVALGMAVGAKPDDINNWGYAEILTPDSRNSTFSYYSDTNGWVLDTWGPNGEIINQPENSRFAQEAYDRIHENPFVTVQAEPLSTFSIDVDTASFTNVRRMLNGNQLPPPDAVRIEEFINYFDYDYAPPAESGHPFAVHTEIASCPWTPANRLMKIGIKGYEIPNEQRPKTNLVFLIDVSGSMSSANKLPLVKESLTLLVNELDERDRVAIVVYAGAAGLVLPSTPGDQKDVILMALENLKSGGSTNGGQGIELAYKTAQENFIEGGANRVILCTDGDFNVGTTDRSALVTLVEERAKKGVFLTLLGFGMGNLKDATMEELSNKGNGNYAYIDTIEEGRKMLVEQIGGTLLTIAKDVKIQVEFNPMKVMSYRLIGYENRALAAEDFNDDTKDAGEIGAGHTVTAIYEIVPGVAQPDGKVDELKYQKTTEPMQAAFAGETCTVKIRYKKPDADSSILMESPVNDAGHTIDQTSEDFKFAASVAAFGMILRRSQHCSGFTINDVKSLATQGLADDVHGYRAGFLKLIDQAEILMPKKQAPQEDDKMEE